MSIRKIILIALSFMASVFASDADESTLRLALALSGEGDHAGASIEFRRLALTTVDPAARAAFAWSAAFERRRAGDPARADTLLDAAEDEHVLPAAMIAALRGELALERRMPAEAAFHFESAGRADDPDARSYAARRQTVAHLRAGDIQAAHRAVQSAGTDAEQALKEYQEGRDKSPWLGGWLGVVPGLGYAYAGEYANALRSLILNGLFIWGMVETAERDQWGAFAVISFFEITWYSGSIYGGIDASHRHNRKRLALAETAITAGYSLQPDYEALPALNVRYRF